MDLLATVRKEGSRGGQGDFTWAQVQNSSRREHYLGHSLMAPVGRWQKGRDLNWYSKAETGQDNEEDDAQRAARERREEIKRVKEAEEDALARALGLPVAPRNNANMEPLGDKQEVSKILKESSGNDQGDVKGVGYRVGGTRAGGQAVHKQIEGDADEDKQLRYALKEYRRRNGGDGRRRSRSRDRETRHRGSHKDLEEGFGSSRRRRHRSRSDERFDRRRSRSRSRTRHEGRREERHRDRRRISRSRSRSPHSRREKQRGYHVRQTKQDDRQWH